MKTAIHTLIILFMPMIVLANMPTDSLVNAIYYKKYDEIKALILAGADLDAIVHTNAWRHSDGTSTPIYYRVWNYIEDDETRKVIKEAFVEMQIPQDTLDKEFEKFFKDVVTCNECSVDKLSTLIYAGANVNHVFTPENTTALLFSFTNKYWGENKMSSAEFIDGILSAGIPVNLQDSVGKTALMYEVENGNYGSTSIEVADRVKVLLKHGADVNIKDHNGMTPLTVTRVRSGESLITTALEKAGAVRNLTEEWWLTLHIYNGDSRLYFELRDLIHDGADANAVAERNMFMDSPTDCIEGNGQNALMFLTKCLNNEAVEELIERGARVDMTDNNGRNALHYLALSDLSGDDSKRQSDCRELHYIFTKHLDISAKDKYGKTAFDYALVNHPYLARYIYRELPSQDKNEMAKALFATLATTTEKQTVNNFIAKCREASPLVAAALPNTLPNELWTKGREVAGTSYFFAEDGQYHYHDYYSGGMYRSYESVGIYEYNPKTQNITLQKVKYSAGINPLTTNIKSIFDTTGFAKSNPKNMFILLNKRMQVDTITIESFINEIPLRLTSIKSDDFKTIINLLNQVDLDNDPNDKHDFQNAVRLSVTVKQSNVHSGNIKATIYPDLNLVEYYNKIYKIDNDNPAWERFRAMFANYF